ncbi:Uncharacterised protein [Mycobacterium tuberculosis]|nr:Uncharacterised protein [Mycobacterium tuberculosis]
MTGERETEDVVGAGLVVLQPVQRATQHQGADLQHAWFGRGQRLHSSGGVADLFLGDFTR